MAFVLDSSVTMSWCFEQEATAYTESVFDRLWETDARVPAIWPFEIANVLLVAERTGRLTESESARFLSMLQSLPIEADAVSLASVIPVVALGRAHGLSAYDAAYLDLAMREGLPLATLDERLRQAANHVGVGLLE